MSLVQPQKGGQWAPCGKLPWLGLLGTPASPVLPLKEPLKRFTKELTTFELRDDLGQQPAGLAASDTLHGGERGVVGGEGELGLRRWDDHASALAQSHGLAGWKSTLGERGC
jgi:hypothetical protein